jgi:hypothetical protein
LQIVALPLTTAVGRGASVAPLKVAMVAAQYGLFVTILAAVKVPVADTTL